MERSIVIIDASTVGVEGTSQQWISYLNQKGIHPHLISIYKGGKWAKEEDVYSQLAEAKPEIIIFGGAAAFRYAESLKSCTCFKLNFWYDDPIMRLEGLGLMNRARECYDRIEQDFKFYIWDNYWLGRMKEKGIECDLTHLAVDPREFYTCDTQLSDECVFIGGLHSRSEIYKRRGWISRIFQKTLDISMGFISSLPIEEEIPSWDKVEAMSLNSLGDGDLRLHKEIEALDYIQVLQARWCLWAHSKNEVRIRALKEVMKVSPLMIFTDTQQKGHANPDELKHMLGYSNLRIIDSSPVRADKLGQIYHYGSLHIGSTDPQSVHSGIPYRVFQTMAAGRPLLTDHKPGWEGALKEKTYFTYNNPLEIEGRVQYLLKNKDEMKEMGIKARLNAASNHTWHSRLRSLLKIDDFNITRDQQREVTTIINDFMLNTHVGSSVKFTDDPKPTNLSRGSFNSPVSNLLEEPC